jgi:DNA repair exonuclease SbcCD ATPase subunit
MTRDFNFVTPTDEEIQLLRNADPVLIRYHDRIREEEEKVKKYEGQIEEVDQRILGEEAKMADLKAQLRILDSGVRSLRGDKKRILYTKMRCKALIKFTEGRIRQRNEQVGLNEVRSRLGLLRGRLKLDRGLRRGRGNAVQFDDGTEIKIELPSLGDLRKS